MSVSAQEMTETRKVYQEIIKSKVLVAGAGPAGFAAALAARRSGADVLLLERYGFPGGAATAAMVHPLMQYQAGGRLIVGGILRELVELMAAEGAAIRPSAETGYQVPFDHEIMKMVMLEMLQKEGVSLLLHTQAVQARVIDGILEGVTIHNKSGCQTVLAQTVVDATGDADIAWMSGAPVAKGREEDGAMQPATICFRLGGVDEDRMPSREEINRLYESAKEKGEINNPRENVLKFTTLRRGEVHFNTTRVTGVDGTDVRDLTRAELESRRQVREMVRFLRRLPGFEGSFLLSVAPQVGIRETRRIIGEYVMTAGDVLEGRQFPDAVAQGSYCIDIHNPQGTGTVIRELPYGAHYDIPYRSLLPLGVENLLVAGRPISTTHEAHASTRIMPICMATGQAAGTAAAVAAHTGKTPREIGVSALQQLLRQQQAILD